MTARSALDLVITIAFVLAMTFAAGAIAAVMVVRFPPACTTGNGSLDD